MPLHDDSDPIRGIGFLALHAARLDSAINGCVSTLLAEADVSHIEIFEQTPARRIQCCLKLLGTCTALPEGLIGLPGLLATALDLFRRKRELIDGSVLAGAAGALRDTGTVANIGQGRYVSPAQIFELANEIADVCSGLEHWMEGGQSQGAVRAPAGPGGYDFRGISGASAAVRLKP